MISRGVKYGADVVVKCENDGTPLTAFPRLSNGWIICKCWRCKQRYKIALPSGELTKIK